MGCNLILFLLSTFFISDCFSFISSPIFLQYSLRIKQYTLDYLLTLLLIYSFIRLEKNENEAEIAVKRKPVPFRWKDLIDSKNKKIGLIDLGNHILIAGVVLIGIFIISNA